MKKLSLILFFISITSFANSGTIGKGEIKLTDYSLEYFMEYIRGGWGKTPDKFVITYDGTLPFYWTCAKAACVPGCDASDIKICEDRSSRKCGVFARGRKVVWKNGINKGNRKSKINSKWTDQQIINKLKKLGFLE